MVESEISDALASLVSFEKPASLDLIAEALQDISEDVQKLEQYYFAVGEVSDVYKGLMVESNRLVSAFIYDFNWSSLNTFLTGGHQGYARHYIRPRSSTQVPRGKRST